MKAKELIEFLEGVDPDTEVRMEDPGCGCCSIHDSVDLEVSIKTEYDFDDNMKTYVYISEND